MEYRFNNWTHQDSYIECADRVWATKVNGYFKRAEWIQQWNLGIVRDQVGTSMTDEIEHKRDYTLLKARGQQCTIPSSCHNLACPNGINTPRLWKTIVLSIIQIQVTDEKWWPGEMTNHCVKYYSDRTWQRRDIDWKIILVRCALWHWPWRYDHGSWPSHTLGSRTIIVQNIFQIEQGSKKLWLTDRQPGLLVSEYLTKG